MSTPFTSIVKRLEALRDLLKKYSHCWGKNPSNRMYLWIDEYNDIKTHAPQAWKAYCEKHGYDMSHKGLDVLA